MLFGIELPMRSREMICDATGMDMAQLGLLENKINIMVQRLQRKKIKHKFDYAKMIRGSSAAEQWTVKNGSLPWEHGSELLGITVNAL